MDDQRSDRSDFVVAMIYMSGDRRGTTSLLGGPSQNIVLEGRTGVRVERPGLTPDADVVAKLRLVDERYELDVMHDQKVWTNGRLATHALLESGDVLEIGRNGPMLRYRSYQDGVILRGSMSEVFGDCYDSARFDHGPLLKKAGLLFGGMTREVLNRTTLAFRIVVLLSIGATVAAIVVLVQQNRALE